MRTWERWGCEDCWRIQVPPYDTKVWQRRDGYEHYCEKCDDWTPHLFLGHTMENPDA